LLGGRADDTDAGRLHLGGGGNDLLAELFGGKLWREGVEQSQQKLLTVRASACLKAITPSI